MAIIQPDGNNANRDLVVTDYTATGELRTKDAELALVVGSASQAENFIANKQWGLLWRDADLLFQAPRPMSVFENTYILEPNVQRFTVAKVVNAVVPQLYKGLFYEDPPMVLRPRPGTSQDVIDAKTALFATLLDQCNFKTETKWGLEQMAHQGTGIWKWGLTYKKIISKKRKASVDKLSAGPVGHTVDMVIPKDAPPDIEIETRYVPRPFFEARELSRVLVDPHTEQGDIQRAKYAIDVRYMDFYGLYELKQAIDALPEGHMDKEGWRLPDVGTLKSWWMPPTNAGFPQNLVSDSAAFIKGVVHHAQEPNIENSPDLLLRKLEVLEYWDKGRKILVIDRKRVICAAKNTFGMIPFFSANWWNRPRAFYGMGLGLIVGQNQRVDQGTINSILKILSFGVNPIYLRKRDSNAPTQMIRTGLGKVLTVDTEVDKSYRLLETPSVPRDVWAALSESEKATESSSGADQTLVQGSSAGPRAGIGRTAGGAGLMANASATRLDGPLDNFIEQVFKPFLYALDMLVFTYFSDAEIFRILGEEMGKAFEVDLQEFHDARIEFETLAGASLAAKRTMAQSMTLIEQVFTNPAIMEQLADINEEYIDIKRILKMWLQSTEWKDFDDLVKPMTQAMKDKRAQKQQAAMQQGKTQSQMQLNQQKGAIQAQLDQQNADRRFQKDIVLSALKGSGESEADLGVPSGTGLESAETFGQ